MKNILFAIALSLLIAGCLTTKIKTHSTSEKKIEQVEDSSKKAPPGKQDGNNDDIKEDVNVPSVQDWDIDPPIAPVNAKVKISCVIVPGKGNRIVDWKMFILSDGKKTFENEGPGGEKEENVKISVTASFGDPGVKSATISLNYLNEDNPTENISKTIDAGFEK